MANTTLTPNYVLRSLISQWCETNGIEPPKRSSQPNKPTPVCSSSERANIDGLLSKLCSPDPEEQRSAAAELRLLAKRNAHNRLCIAEAGAIPLLLSLLSSSDLRTQEHAVTALLNLSIHEDNKASIMSSGAVPSVVHVLKNGSMEARENAAATLFSLSVIDEYKVQIGGTGAIPALVVLLSEGSQRGKKDAAAALFNLCIYQGNKGRAIRAGLVPLIMGLVTNPIGALMDEAMAILSILSSHQEGKAAIGAAEPIPALVELIGNGSPRNRENAAAVMLHLCSSEQQLVHLTRAHECGIMVPLRELALNGTERGKRKAVQLLERMSRFLVHQQEEQESHCRVQAASAQVPSQTPEQIQENEIPDQLDSPASQYPMLL
jgi:HEAT repeat protein